MLKYFVVKKKKRRMEELQESQFNMGIAYMQRLDFLLKTADDNSRFLDSFHWYHTLATIFRELSPEMNEKELQEYLTELKSLNMQISQETEQNQKKGKIGITNDLYFSLNKLEISLRQLMQKRGLYNKQSKDPSKAVFQ
jgi:hypothetical protein